MDDSNEGSSSAALSAQVDTPEADKPLETEQKSSFFGRIIGALSPSDTGEEPDQDMLTARNSPSHGVFNLRSMAVEDVMIPQADIVSVPSTISKDELVQVFRESGLTRLPVYEDTLDTPIGMAHLKDFALEYGFNGGSKGRFALKKMLRPLMFVPPSMPIGVLLAKMQAERKHMALVIDEYGGVDGLATIEDLIEQVVGEIEDEHDSRDAALWSKESAGSYLAFAKAPLDDFESEFGLSLTDVEDVDPEEIDTLGGLVFMLTGRVPVRGEVVKHPTGTEFEIIDADPRRIKRMRVRPPKHLNG